MVKHRQVIIFLMVAISFILVGCQRTALSEGEIAEIPKMTVTIGENAYTVYHGNYWIEKREGGSTMMETTDAPSPNQIAEDFTPFIVNPSEQVDIDIDGKPQMKGFEWDANGQIGEIKITEQSFKLPKDFETMIIEVVATWKNAEASYTFVVDLVSTD